jgi:peroxiredoxin family protein
MNQALNIEGMVCQFEALSQAVAALQVEQPKNRLSMVVFSGDLDKLLAALIIATGAAASGMQVQLFFTFWGTAALRTESTVKKDIWGKLIGWMLPRGPQKLKLSQMHWAGAGTAAMKYLMSQKGVASLPELLSLAGELDVHIDVCTMSMELMGISRDELIDYPHLGFCGVTSFVEVASTSKTTLFI